MKRIREKGKRRREKRKREKRRNKKGTVDFISFQTPPAPVPRKFMVCMGHRLQCKMPNRTKHKFPEEVKLSGGGKKICFAEN